MKKNDILASIKRNSPGILTGLGIGGMLGAIVLAVEFTPKAKEAIEKEKIKSGHKKLTVAQTIKATWKYYIPSALSFGASTACIIGASSINGKRNAALATAYSIAETTLQDYKDRVVEVIGEEKNNDILREIHEKQIERDEPTEKEIMPIAEGEGTTLCYDAMFGRYFYSDRNSIERAANKLNRDMATMTEPYVSLNEWYMELNISTTEIGDMVGWNLSNGLIEPIFTCHLANGHIPCLVVTYRVFPKYEFYNPYEGVY